MMNLKIFFLAIFAGVFSAIPCCFAGDLVEGSDARAEPMKAAVAALAKQIDAGDFDKAKAEYAGDGADLDLLKAYVDGVAAAKAMRAAMQAKFGDQIDKDMRGLDTDLMRMGVHDYNTVIFLDDPDRASSSADNPLGVGIEFKRVDGKWKVMSLASRPDSAKEHLARLTNYISKVKATTEDVKSGACKSSDDAQTAAVETEEQLSKPAPAK
jgi:hypothetical protein